VQGQGVDTEPEPPQHPAQPLPWAVLGEAPDPQVTPRPRDLPWDTGEDNA